MKHYGKYNFHDLLYSVSVKSRLIWNSYGAGKHVALFSIVLMFLQTREHLHHNQEAEECYNNHCQDVRGRPSSQCLFLYLWLSLAVLYDGRLRSICRSVIAVAKHGTEVENVENHVHHA